MKVKLEDVCKRIYAGGDVPKGRYSEVKTEKYSVPIYANAEKDNGLYGYTDEARETELSITVAARGTIGFTAIRREPFLPVIRLITVVPDIEIVSERYLYYVLKNCKPRSSGTSIPQLTVPDIKRNSLELYDISEQKHIADQLDMVNKVIDLRKQELESLDNLIKARFVEMFGNIKENRFIKCKMREVAHIKHGYAYSGEYFSDKDNGVVLVTPGNFALGGGFQEIKNKYFTSKYPEEYVLHPGDLIVTMTDLSKKADTLGYGAIIPDNTSKIYLHNQRIGLFDELDKRLNPVFVRWFMQTDEYRLEIVRTSTGSTVHHTSPDRILDSLIFLPPIQLQNDFVKFANQVNKSKVILPKPPFNVII